jgi:hypothetical protein
MGTDVGTGLYPMPETTKTTVTQDSDGYYRVRIPKALGDGFDLAGEKVEWKPLSQDALRMEKHD